MQTEEEESAYQLELMVASQNEGSTIKLIVNNKEIKNEVIVPGTSGKWQTCQTKEIQLKKGTNVIRIKAESGQFHFKSIQFKSV